MIKTFLSIATIAILCNFNSFAQNEFITTWKTDNAGTSTSTQITIPTTGGGYSYDVDWNDDGVFDQFGITGSVTHDFVTAGTYTIRIQGVFPRIYFNSGGDRRKLLSVDQWGTNPWISMQRAFDGCENIHILATDAPDLTSCTTLAYTFNGCHVMNEDLSSWNVSNISNFTAVFFDCFAFNQPLSTWNVSNATNMFAMFLSTPFNQDISNWDVSGVGSFSWMFRQATSFNQDISGWNTSSATNFSEMFRTASSFDQNIGGWDVTGVTNATNMFQNAALSTINYDSLLFGWSAQALQNGVTFSGGNSNFCNADQEHASIISTFGWTITDNGQNCVGQEFITTWQTDNTGTSTSTQIIIPTTGGGYDYDVDWDNDGIYDEFGLTGNVTHDFVTAGTYTIRIKGDFPRIYFNSGGDRQKILSVDAWGNIEWTDFTRAFYGCSNMILTATDAPDLSDVTSMNLSFRATDVNAGFENWDVSTITNFTRMFYDALFMNGDISAWNTISATTFQAMFLGSPFNQDIGGWNTSNANDMVWMFYNTDFNQDIGAWDVSGVTNMTRMFYSANDFNQDLSSWTTTSLTNVNEMFSAATSFDQNIGGWDVTGVTNATNMFQNVTLSTANYDSLLFGWSTQPLQNGVTFSGGNSHFCNADQEHASMISTYGWTITDNGPDCGGTDFVTTWQTDNAGTSSNTEITIPTTGGGYNYDVDWDNDGIYDEFGLTGNVTHDFVTAGTYTIRIKGDFPRMYFNLGGDRRKLLSIDQWGTNPWTSLTGAFRGCQNMHIVATDAPNLENCSSLYFVFAGCFVMNESINHWDVSTISNFGGIFYDCTSFDQPLNLWDVSNGVNMYGMFLSSPFNQDISGWDVSGVGNFTWMFRQTTSFNQDISGWNTASATNFSEMFQSTSNFDQNLGSWDVTSLTNATNMFQNAALSTANYDALLIGWNAQNVNLGVTLGAGNSMYCAGEDARANLIATKFWNITDGGVDDATGPTPDVAALADITAECEVTALTDPTATDNCSSTVTVSSDAVLPINAQGTTVVTWTYDDGHGNTSTQTQNVVIDDVTNPVPDAASLTDLTAECEITSLTAPTATDNCNGTVTVMNDATLPITTQGTTTITWTYDDGHGNTSMQTQDVVIDDVTAPAPDVATLADVTAECEITSLTAPTATDNCNGTVTVTNDATLPINTQGTTTVTWAYDDGHGNTSTQTQNVVIDDVTAPAPDVATLADVTAECEITSLTAPTATDNCNGTVTVTNDATLPINTQGTTTVTWTYDDGHGNTSTQTQDVVINDVTTPIADVATLADVTAECEITSLTAPTATDNCNGTVIVTNDATLPINTQGTTTVTWTYDDGHGNTSTQTQDIVIDDVTAPTPDVATLTDVTAECEITSLTGPTANDNCNGTVTVTNDATLPINTQGTTVVTWTYEDAEGNTSTQTQDVIINDLNAPVPDAATLSDLTDNCEVATLAPPTATDNCSATITVTNDATLPITTIGTTVVTWTYDDGNGNTSTQTQDVIISGIDVSTTLSAEGITITATNTNATYQWIDCATMLPIVGETNQTFTATQNGDYAVIVDEGGCIDTSSCVTVSTVGITPIDKLEVTIYPNPVTNGTFQIQTDEKIEMIRMFDLLGKEVVISVDNNSVNASELSAGEYLIELSSASSIIRRKVIIR